MESMNECTVWGSSDLSDELRDKILRSSRKVRLMYRSLMSGPGRLRDEALRRAAVSSGRAPAPASYRVLYPLEEPCGFRLLVVDVVGVRKRAWFVCHVLPSVMTPV